MTGDALQKGESVANSVTLISRESSRIYRRIYIYNLLKQRCGSAERVPEHRRQIRHDLAFLAQFEQRIFPCVGIRQFDYPRINFLAIHRCLQCRGTLLGTHIFAIYPFLIFVLSIVIVLTMLRLTLFSLAWVYGKETSGRLLLCTLMGVRRSADYCLEASTPQTSTDRFRREKTLLKQTLVMHPDVRVISYSRITFRHYYQRSTVR